MKNLINNNKRFFTGKYVRVDGVPAQITGAGKSSLMLSFRMPKGFSVKKELTKGWVNWEDITPELRKQLKEIWAQHP